MPAIRTMKLDWVNKGQPFEVGQGRFAPEDFRQGLVAKVQAMKELLAGLEALPAEDQAELRKNAKDAATISHADAVIYSFLSRIDPSLKDLGPAGVREKLVIDEYKALVDSISDASAAAAGGRPLVKPPS